MKTITCPRCKSWMYIQESREGNYWVCIDCGETSIGHDYPPAVEEEK